MKKRYFAAATLLAALTLTPITSSSAASGRTSENGGWVCYDNDGNRHRGWTQTKGGCYYMGTASGVVLKGFKKIDDKWYYFNSNNLVQTDWIKDEGRWHYRLEGGVFVQEDRFKVGENYFFIYGTGKLAVGWRNMNDNRYYFKANGRCAFKWMKIGNDQFWMGTDDKMRTGWQQVEGIYCYFSQDGKMKASWLSGGTNRYYMDPESSRMVHNWKQINSAWMFSGANGHMMTGWIRVNDCYYCLGTDGKMVSNTTLTLNGISYTFDGNGTCTGNESIPATGVSPCKEPKQGTETASSDTKSSASNDRKSLPSDETTGPGIKRNN